MSKYLGSTLFRELLAPSIAGDPAMRAAADALDGVLNAATRAIPRVLLYARLAHASGHDLLPPLARLTEQTDGLAPLDDRTLELLAWQLHTEGFEVALTTQAKEALVNESVPIHRLAGTPWALRRALELALETDVLVPEWFQYGGCPYFFKVRFAVPPAGLSEARQREVFRLIYEKKNVRSWLDGVETGSVLPLPEYIGTGLAGRTATRPRLWFTPSPPLPLRQWIGAAASHVTSSRLLPFSPPGPASPAAVSPRMAVSAVTRFRLAVPARQEVTYV